MTTFYAGQRIRAALLEQFVPLFVEKTSDQSVTSSTTLVNDNELLIANIPVGTWQLFGELFMDGTSAGTQDVKYAFTFPTGVISWSGVSIHEDWANSASNRDVSVGGVVGVSSSPTSAKPFGAVTGTSMPTQISGHLVNTVAGTLRLQWAQNTSNATATTVKAGSWLCLRKAVIVA